MNWLMKPVIRYKVPCGHICGQTESKPELVMMMNPIDLVLSFSACPQMGMKIDYLGTEGSSPSLCVEFGKKVSI